MFLWPITKVPLGDNKSAHGVHRKGRDALLWSANVFAIIREQRGATLLPKGYRKVDVGGIGPYRLRKSVRRRGRPEVLPRFHSGGRAGVVAVRHGRHVERARVGGPLRWCG